MLRKRIIRIVHLIGVTAADMLKMRASISPAAISILLRAKDFHAAAFAFQIASAIREVKAGAVGSSLPDDIRGRRGDLAAGNRDSRSAHRGTAGGSARICQRIGVSAVRAHDQVFLTSFKRAGKRIGIAGWSGSTRRRRHRRTAALDEQINIMLSAAAVELMLRKRIIRIVHLIGVTAADMLKMRASISPAAISILLRAKDFHAAAFAFQIASAIREVKAGAVGSSLPDDIRGRRGDLAAGNRDSRSAHRGTAGGSARICQRIGVSAVRAHDQVFLTSFKRAGKRIGIAGRSGSTRRRSRRRVAAFVLDKDVHCGGGRVCKALTASNMGISENAIFALQIIPIRLSSIGVAVGRTGVLEVPQEILSVGFVMPELSGITAVGLITRNSENDAAAGIQILAAILQPEAWRTTGAGLLLGSEGCLFRVGRIQSDLVARSRCGDGL